MDKTLGVLRIIFWVIVIALALALLIYITTGGSAWRNTFGGSDMSNGNWQILSDAKYPAGGVTSVSITGRSEDIRILHSDDGQFRVYEAYRSAGLGGGDPLPADVQTRGGTFYVESARNSYGFVIFGWNEHIMDIYVPDAHWESFTTKLSSGKLTADGIEAVNIELGCNSGEIDLGGVRADEHLEIGITSGRVTVKDSASKTGNIEVSSGEIRLDSYSAESLSAKTTSGSIRGTDVKAGALTTKTSSGTVDLDGSFSDVNSRATSGSISIRSDITPEKLSVDISSGTVKCYLPSGSEFDINYRVSSGTVKSDWHDTDGKKGQTGNGARIYDVEITSGTARFIKD